MNKSFLLSSENSFIAVLLSIICGAGLACYHMRKQKRERAVKTKIVGITGTIASGKSLVGNLLEEMGVPVLDTDSIAHDVESTDSKVRADLRSRFGDFVFKENGELNRKELGRIVFNDPEALKELNRIVHPAVINECRRRIQAFSSSPLVAVLVPLLFEAGVDKDYDEIWTVTAADEVVLERLKAREGISGEEAEKRIRAQLSQKEKMARSDYVIDNSGTVDDTRRRVAELLNMQR